MSNFAQAILCLISIWLTVVNQPALARNQVELDWVFIQSPAPPGPFEIARTETTVGQFREFARATQWVTRAERMGGGQVYEAGWVQKPGWNWASPFGRPAQDNEPAVHVTWTMRGPSVAGRGATCPPMPNGLLRLTPSGAPNPPPLSKPASATATHPVSARKVRNALRIAAPLRKNEQLPWRQDCGAAMVMPQ